MSTTTGQGDLLGRNEVTLPTFDHLATGSPAPGWQRGAAVPTVGGRDRNGDPVPNGALHSETTVAAALSTLLPARTAGETLHVLVDYSNGGGTSAGVSAELVTDRMAALQPPGPSCVVLPVSWSRTVAAAELVVPAAGDVWLRLTSRAGSINSRLFLFGVRVDDALDDELGIFSGATEDTEDVTYAWTEDPFASPSIATTPDGEEPPPDPTTLARHVADLLGAAHDDRFLARSAQAITVVTAMAREYTRGRGFTATGMAVGIEAVVVTAAMRLLANPEQIDHGLGGQWARGGFSGWTLAEQYVLNGYRKRTSG